MAVNVTDLKAREASAPPIPEEETATPLPGYTCELTRPIEAHGQTVTTLVFREPTARDLLSIGNPVIFDPISDPPKIMHDEKRMNQMLSALAGVPPSAIANLTTRDFITCAWGVTPFFVPVPGKI
jgi:hypothetical protein